MGTCVSGLSFDLVGSFTQQDHLVRTLLIEAEVVLELKLKVTHYSWQSQGYLAH